MKTTISAAIITKNEATMIEACLKGLGWCDEIVIIDDNSTDKTTSIAENYGAKIISFSHPSFARKRQEALKRTKSDWIFYIDADERITPQLAKEIKVNIETHTADVFTLCRDNIFYGKKLENGGWQEDEVERVFFKKNLEGWFGDIHESPRYAGIKKTLHSPLIHLSHRNTISGLLKTSAWTPMEAQALYDSKLPKVTFITIMRKMIMEFIRRIFFKNGYKDGQTGLIEGLIQAINKALVYIQVWELQQKPSISDLYLQKEKEIESLWQKQM